MLASRQRLTVGLSCLLVFGGFCAGHAGDLLISAFDAGGGIVRYDSATGDFVNYYVPESVNGHGIMVGPDCNLYVASTTNDSVLRFSTTSEPTGIPLPSETGTPGTAEFVAPGAGGLDFIGSSDFGPDGNLYVASASSVLRFDGTTGEFIDVFVPDGSGGLAGAALLKFGADGDLYVPGTASNGVYRYDGITGDPKPGDFADPGTAQFATDPGLNQVHNFDFGPNGNLYLSDYTGDKVLEFDGTTGGLVSVVVPAGSNLFAHGLTFGPDGNFYTASLGSPEIRRYDPDGTPLGVFIDGTGVFDGASKLVFPSENCSTPVPVPDGRFGTALTVDKVAGPGGPSLRLTWDVSTCQAAGYHLLYGALSGVADYTLDGALCDLGSLGTASWTASPSGDTWFVIVGDDGAGTEGSWGTNFFEAERNNSGSSGLCGNSARDNEGTCPPTP